MRHEVLRVGTVLLSWPGTQCSRIDEAVSEAKAVIDANEGVCSITLSACDFSHAREAGRKLRREGIEALILICTGWSEPPNAVEVASWLPDTPILLWAFTGYNEPNERISTGGMILASSLKPLLERAETPFIFLAGMPWEPGCASQARGFMAAAKAYKVVRRARLGLVGFTAMGIYNGCIDPAEMRIALGAEVVHIDTLSLIRRMEFFKTGEVRQVLQDAPIDWPDAVGKDSRENVARMYLALNDLCSELQLDGVSVKCHFELSRDLRVTACLPLSILANEIPASCEGDLAVLLFQIILAHLSGSRSGFGDIHDVFADDIFFAGCGFMPTSLVEGNKALVEVWDEKYAGGLVNARPVKEGNVTLLRIQSLGHELNMHAAAGQVVKTGRAWREVGCPPCSGGVLRLDSPVTTFIQSIIGHHYAFCAGNYLPELTMLAQLLRLKPTNEAEKWRRLI